MALEIGPDMVEQLYRNLYLCLDSYMLGNSRLLDFWDERNPRGFSYDYNYFSYLEDDSTRYLTQEDRFFINRFAMTYPREDRALLFTYACLPDNQEYFSARGTQRKLELLCETIRDAFGLKNAVYLWEQYLSDPLT